MHMFMNVFRDLAARFGFRFLHPKRAAKVLKNKPNLPMPPSLVMFLPDRGKKRIFERFRVR